MIDMDNGNNPTEHPADAGTIPAANQPTSSSSQSNKVLIGVVAGVIVILVVLVVAVWLLIQPSTDTARVRDIFIIFMALESLLIGMTLVILIVQLARLINLLQNEIKPILDSTNETVSNLRGTTAFLSENLVGPVIKMNEYLAGLSQMLKLIGIARKSPKVKDNEK
jgi:hypothetical protein